jgi:hypothetical protein
VHITGSRVAYDTGFPGYNIFSTGYPKAWQIVAGLRLGGGGFAIIDQQLTAGYPSSSNNYQIRMYRLNSDMSVSEAVYLSKDATDTPGSAIAGASVVSGTSEVAFTTSNVASQVSVGLHCYTYDFSGTPALTSSNELPGSQFGGVGGGRVPIACLAPGLSVAVPNNSLAFQGILGLAWQWSEGIIVITGGSPAPMINVPSWHTTIVSNNAVGGNYYITDIARLSSSTFVVIAVKGNTGGSGAAVGQATFLMQMDTSGNILSQSQVPESLISTVSQGYERLYGPYFQRDLTGGLYLSFINEAGYVAAAGSMGAPLVIALDPSTGQPSGGVFHQKNILPLGPGFGNAHPQPYGDFTRIIHASGIGGGRWFCLTPQKVCVIQQSVADAGTGGPAAYGTYVDRSYWGASASRDFPTPPDLSPPGSCIGLFPAPFPGAPPTNPGYYYTAIFALSANNAICVTSDYTPGTVVPGPIGAIAGTPGFFTPAGSTVPANLAALSGLFGVGPYGTDTAWATGQYVTTADGAANHWTATGWVAGKA